MEKEVMNTATVTVPAGQASPAVQIENLSIQFGDTNYYGGTEWLDKADFLGGFECPGEEDVIVQDADEVAELIAKRTKIPVETVYRVLDAEDEILDGEEEVLDDLDLETDGEGEESMTSTESTEGIESTGSGETTGHETPTGDSDGHSSRSTRSELLYALVRAITAEELLKDAMRKGERHGSEK